MGADTDRGRPGGRSVLEGGGPYNLAMPPRFYTPDLARPDEPVELPVEEARHLTQVLRLGAGDTVSVFDGRGVEYLARVEHVPPGRVVARPYQRRGIATEAAGAVMQAVQSLDDVYRIWASCDADNPASAGVLRGLDMQFEGCLRRRSARPNRADVIGPQDDHIYAWVR